jgi:hypothetical protein
MGIWLRKREAQDLIHGALMSSGSKRRNVYLRELFISMVTGQAKNCCFRFTYIWSLNFPFKSAVSRKASKPTRPFWGV